MKCKYYSLQMIPFELSFQNIAGFDHEYATLTSQNEHFPWMSLRKRVLTLNHVSLQGPGLQSSLKVKVILTLKCEISKVVFTLDIKM